MSYSLEEINFKTVADPRGFVEECDAVYHARVAEAAERIIMHMARSQIVLLSGPSGSGKTTTAMKIAEALKLRGVNTHYISMDNYFKTVRPDTVPRTPDGEMDLESPYCLDLELLRQHFGQLSRGERVYVPKYEFSRQMRVQDPSLSIRLKQDEVVILEGIHALNDLITDECPEAFRQYISTGSDVEFEGVPVFRRAWFRLVRRMVRDYNFRGSDPLETMRMWGNVCRGEEHYIAPFQNKAHFQLDSSFAYEMAVFNEVATRLFQSVPEGIERFDELRKILPALQLFGVIDEALVAPDAMIREFIGGGIYEY